MTTYAGNWTKKEDIDYPEAKEIPEDDLIFAGYETPDYEGYAFVLFKKDGKLFEVNDSHCSCNGLENWTPEETSKEAVAMRFEGGRYVSWPGLKEELAKLGDKNE